MIIHGSLESLGDSAFEGCSSLSSLYIVGTVAPSTGEDVFTRCRTSAVVHVPCGSCDAYRSSEIWSQLSISEDMVIMPSVAEDLVYDGSVKTGVTSVSGAFTVTDNEAVSAGDYTAHLSLADGCVWADDFGTEDRTVSWHVIPRTVNVSGIGAESKVYDGTVSVTLTYDGVSLSGVAAGDEVTLTAAGAFSDGCASAGKTVNITEMTLTGASAGNYVLATENMTVTADISSRLVTVSGITADSKTYDGSRTAHLRYDGVVLAGVVNGDTVMIEATGTFDSPDAGSHKTVTISDIVIEGPSAGNYILSSDCQSVTTADVTKEMQSSLVIIAAVAVVLAGILGAAVAVRRRRTQ